MNELMAREKDDESDLANFYVDNELYRYTN